MHARCLETNFELDGQRFGDEGWSVSYQDCKLSQLDYSALYAKMWFPTATKYWAKKHKISEDIIRTVDWDICRDAVSSLPFTERRRLVKHATGQFGVGTKMLLWKFEDHDNCPLCGDQETPEHVILCPDPRASATWSSSLLKLEEWMTFKHTDPALQAAILSRLNTWHANDGLSPLDTTSPVLHAVYSQDDIGWYPFLHGHISHYWMGIQQAYYTSLNLDNTGKQWTKQLLQKLFNVSWDMWEHRNGIKHKTLTPARIRALRNLETSIRAEYHKGNTALLLRDKQLLSKPLQTVLAYPCIEQEQWLSSVSLARIRWSRRRESARASQDASRQVMRTWLHTPSTSLSTSSPPARSSILSQIRKQNNKQKNTQIRQKH